MPRKPERTPPSAIDPRRRALLDAALTVFTRFGFRKASMDDVARAAQLSRQGLYLHFATKDELFQATLEHVLGAALVDVKRELAAPKRALAPRLVRAFDAWVGRFVGSLGGAAADLTGATSALAKHTVAEHEDMFLDAVTRALRSSPLAAAYKPASVSARQLAETLQAAARGLKQSSASRAEFVESFGVVARAICAPLREAA